MYNIDSVYVAVFINFVRSKMMLHAGVQVNTRLILGYYRYLLKLPQSFFDSMRSGEILSRMADAARINTFINSTLLTIVIFGFIIYNDYNGSSSKTASVNAEKNTVKQTESEKVTKAETDTKKNSNRTQVQGNPTVCIDAAHGGSSTGGASGNYTEKAITLSVALKVKEYLEESGVNVVMTRTSDRDVTNEQRVKTCNDSKASAMVSIHMNSADKTVTAKGAECWVHTKKPADSQKLAEDVLKQLKSEAGFNDRGVKYGTVADNQENYYINSHSSCASMVLQLGFITDSTDVKLVTDKLDTTATAIADGIVEYLNGKAH